MAEPPPPPPPTATAMLVPQEDEKALMSRARSRCAEIVAPTSWAHDALLLAAGFSAGVLVSVAAVLLSLRASGVQVGFASFIGLSLLPTSPPRRAHRVSTADLDW